jgi:hypothetical protein
MQHVTVNGMESQESRIVADQATIEIDGNEEPLQIYGAHNQVHIKANNSSLNVYGDRNAVRIHANTGHLHIYGDYVNVLVETNAGSLHIYGTHHNVVVLAGKAAVLGHYGNVSFPKQAAVEKTSPIKTTHKVK